MLLMSELCGGLSREHKFNPEQYACSVAYPCQHVEARLGSARLGLIRNKSFTLLRAEL